MRSFVGGLAAFVAAALVGSAAADEVPALKISPRAFQCQSYEYAELSDMPRAELDGAFCGYVAGANFAKERADLNKEKYQEQPGILQALLGDYVRQSERCTQGMEKIADSLSRRFSASPPDCKSALARLQEARQKSANPGGAVTQ